MAKKKIKRKVLSKRSSVSHSGVKHEHNAKTIIPLLVLLLAFGMFGLFYTYQQNIIDSNSFNLFMVLAVIGMALLVSLLFLINPKKS